MHAWQAARTQRNCSMENAFTSRAAVIGCAQLKQAGEKTL
jgi:hypothetical protein